MKQLTIGIFIMLAALVCSASCGNPAKKSPVKGPEGGISYKITLPKGFDPATERCPMVILMHGIFASKDVNPMPALAKGLAEAGIASIRFDFDGHGKSEGRRQDMTIWISTEQQPTIRDRYSCCTATTTASYRCGAAKSTCKPTADAHHCRSWRARTTPSPANGKRS